MTKKEFAADIKKRAQAERAAGGSIKINRSLPWIAIVRSDGSEYFFQEWEASELLDGIPDYVNEADFLLAMSQGW